MHLGGDHEELCAQRSGVIAIEEIDFVHVGEARPHAEHAQLSAFHEFAKCALYESRTSIAIPFCEPFFVCEPLTRSRGGCGVGLMKVVHLSWYELRAVVEVRVHTRHVVVPLQGVSGEPEVETRRVHRQRF